MTHLLFALVIAILLAAVFVPVVGWRRPGREDGALAYFFVVVFLLTWAVGAWMVPVGPLLWGAPWASFLAVGVIIALLMTATAPPDRSRARVASGPEDDPRVAEVSMFNSFFWLLLIGTVVMLLLAYL